MTLATIDELTIIADELYKQIQGLSDEEKKKLSIDTVSESSIAGYLNGFHRNEWDDTEAELDDIEEAMFVLYDGQTFEDRIKKHIDEGTWDKPNIFRLIETEYHRCEEAGANDYVEKYQERHNVTVLKTYRTMEDDRVREAHFYLEGKTIGWDEEFYTYDGDHAPYPGKFTSAENNANCRCWVEYRVRENS